MFFKRKCIFFICFLFLFQIAQTQTLAGLGARWSDDFGEWIIYTIDESLEGELKTKWRSQNNWTEWQYRVGEVTGSIKLKWPNNPNEWELRSENKIISARTLWRDNFQEWRISDNKNRLTLKTKYSNSGDEWALRSSTVGYFGMYTSWEGDPREWEIIDELDEDVSFQ